MKRWLFSGNFSRNFSRNAGRLLFLLPCALGLGRCNLYEGRSLDLFPPAVDQALECRDSKDCPGDRAQCARGSCVQCLLDLDCDRRHPACVGNACVECRSNENCGADQNCNSVLNLCSPVCVQASDCTKPDARQCSTELDLCVQCVGDTDCIEPKAPVCDRGGRCVACRTDLDCAADAGKPVCISSDAHCAECNGDEQCASGQRCELPAGRCAPDPKQMPMPMPAQMPMPMPAGPPGP